MFWVVTVEMSQPYFVLGRRGSDVIGLNNYTVDEARVAGGPTFHPSYIKSQDTANRARIYNSMF